MVKLAPIHLTGAVISIALMYQSFRLVRKRKESVLEFLLWSGFGMALLVLSLSSAVTVQGTLNYLEKFLAAFGFKTGVNGVFTLAILGILLMLFYTYVNTKTNRKIIFDLNQELALFRYESESNRTNQDERYNHRKSMEDKED